MYGTDICKECMDYCQEEGTFCPCETGDCQYEWELQAGEDEW